MAEDVTYTISELAEEFDVSTRTIRYYEEVGLLHPGLERSFQPARLYTQRPGALETNTPGQTLRLQS